VGLSILIIDDETSFVFALKKLLAGYGIESDYAETPHKALLMLSKRSYDVTLIDLHLPYLKGTDLAEIFHSKYPRMRAVMMSGSGTIEDYLDAQSAGIIDFIHKPFDVNILVRMINEIVRSSDRNLKA